MADTRKTIQCDYCSVRYTLKFDRDETANPDFCAFCGESLAEDEDEDDDLDN